MVNNSINHNQKNKQELNTLKVLIRSLKYQLEELNKTNQKIGQINSEPNDGGLPREK